MFLSAQSFFALCQMRQSLDELLLCTCNFLMKTIWAWLFLEMHLENLMLHGMIDIRVTGRWGAGSICGVRKRSPQVQQIPVCVCLSEHPNIATHAYTCKTMLILNSAFELCFCSCLIWHNKFEGMLFSWAFICILGFLKDAPFRWCSHLPRYMTLGEIIWSIHSFQATYVKSQSILQH